MQLVVYDRRVDLSIELRFWKTFYGPFEFLMHKYIGLIIEGGFMVKFPSREVAVAWKINYMI